MPIIFNNIPWILGVLGGGYFILLGFGLIAKYPKNKEAQQQWMKGSSFVMKVIGLAMLFSGIMLYLRHSPS